MLGWFSAEAALASRAKRRLRSRFATDPADRTLIAPDRARGLRPAALPVRPPPGGQALDRDRPVEMAVARLVHGAHPPLTQLFDDLVVTNGSADQGSPSAALSYHSRQ